MTLSVNFNPGANRVHRNLVVAERQVNGSLSRLSSGERLSSAADDPSALVIANNLRYQTSALSRATQNVEEGTSMLQTAEGAMDEISSLLQRVRSLALDAANDGVNDASRLTALQTDFNEAVASITRIAENSSFGSLKLLQGAMAGNELTSAAKDFLTGINDNAAALPGGIQPGTPLTVTAAAPVTLDRSRTQVTLTTGPAVGAPTGTTLLQNLYQNGTQLDSFGGNVIVTGPKGSATVAVGPTTTINDFVALVNAAGSTTGVRAAFQAGASNGTLMIESSSYGSGALTIESASMSTGGVGLMDSAPGVPATNTFTTAGTAQTINLGYTDRNGTARTMTLTQDPLSPGGLDFVNATGGPESTAPFTAFEPGAFTVTVKDTATISGTAPTTFVLPTGSYVANRTSSTKIMTGALASQQVTIDLPDLRANALGHTAGLAASGMPSLQSAVSQGALLNGLSDNALRLIDASIDEVSIARGKQGSIISSSLETTLSSLRGTITNLTSAESNLRDTDFAQESANFTRNNIAYQAAMAMLAQANQVPQTVLQLLQSNR